MKTTKNIWVIALAALAFAGCQKDQPMPATGDLILVAERMGDNHSKLAINDNVSTWADGDQVRINGATPTVSVGGGTTTVSGPFTAPYYGVYPAGIYGGGECTSTYTLNLPASYTYATTNDGVTQNLQSPMVAYSESNTCLYFKHVTAAIGVQVTNNFGIDVKLTNITISSNSYKLSGTTTVTFDTEHDTVIVNPVTKGESPDADTAVQMTFGTGLEIASGTSVTVQVPVRPVGAGNKFTISVTVVNKDDAEMEYTFTKTQGNGQASYILNRAQIGYAPAKFGGVFTVASGKQVRFAPGNLQYQASGGGTWRFAKHQYDYIGSAAGNNVTEANGRYTQTAWIDIFSWATSGYDNRANDEYATRFMPYLQTISDEVNATYNKYGYGPSTNMTDKSLVGNSAQYDWGVHNAISNGGDKRGIWRTLSAGNAEGEWYYLLGLGTSTPGSTCRSVSNTLCTQGRYIMATIGNTYKGLIIFPDDYVHPEGTGFVAETDAFNTKTDYAATVSIDGWKKMEVAGAVFLPAAGYRTYNVSMTNPNSQGRYWSVNYYDKSAARYVYFSSSAVNQSSMNRCYGCAVRLVRDVQ